VQFLVQAMVLPCSGEGKVVKQAEQGTNIQADQAAAARQLNSHWAGSLALAEPQGPQQSAQGRWLAQALATLPSNQWGVEGADQRWRGVLASVWVTGEETSRNLLK